MKFSTFAPAVLMAALVVGATAPEIAHAVKLGPAGCGLGHMALHNDNQVFAATTNATSGNQTFGITSGTSDCGDGRMNPRAAATMFIDGNRLALANEAARGQGETLTTLSAMLGCGDSAAFGRELKAHYDQIFTRNATNAIGISDSIHSTIEGSPALARTCKTPEQA